VLVVVVRQIIAQRYGLHVAMEMLVLAQLGFQIPLGWIANIEVRASRDDMIDHATTHGRVRTSRFASRYDMMDHATTHGRGVNIEIDRWRREDCVPSLRREVATTRFII
jgi:hypothetical protein